MNLNEYQEKSVSTAIYPNEVALAYVALGLSGEAGEIANKVKKLYRDGDGTASPEKEKELAKELGDVLWYVAMMAYELGFRLDEIAQMNVDKLSSRKERGVIGGSGDER